VPGPCSFSRSCLSLAWDCHGPSGRCWPRRVKRRLFSSGLSSWPSASLDQRSPRAAARWSHASARDGSVARTRQAKRYMAPRWPSYAAHPYSSVALAGSSLPIPCANLTKSAASPMPARPSRFSLRASSPGSGALNAASRPPGDDTRPSGHAMAVTPPVKR
jgi:hypothetical protein